MRCMGDVADLAGEWLHSFQYSRVGVPALVLQSVMLFTTHLKTALDHLIMQGTIFKFQGMIYRGSTSRIKVQS